MQLISGSISDSPWQWNAMGRAHGEGAEGWVGLLKSSLKHDNPTLIPTHMLLAHTFLLAPASAVVSQQIFSSRGQPLKWNAF